MEKKQLWRVPLIALITALVWLPLMIPILGPLALTTLPDGTITSNPVGEIISYGIGMVVVLLAGGFLLLRKVSKKQIFYSAAILVIYHIIYDILSFIIGASGNVSGGLNLFLYYLYQPLEWTSFPALLIRHIFPGEFGFNAYTYLTGIPQYFVPFLFILFGKGRGNQTTKDEAAPDITE